MPMRKRRAQKRTFWPRVLWVTRRRRIHWEGVRYSLVMRGRSSGSGDIAGLRNEKCDETG
jgi:hypothetical protein